MAAMPTERSLAFAREQGWHPAVVERWVAGRIRKDVYGCIDLIVVQPGQPGVLGVQATTTANAATREQKIALELRDTDKAAVLAFLESGNRLEVWGWSKRGGRGKRKLWEISRRPLTAERIGFLIQTCRPLSGPKPISPAGAMVPGRLSPTSASG